LDSGSSGSPGFGWKRKTTRSRPCRPKATRLPSTASAASPTAARRRELDGDDPVALERLGRLALQGLPPGLSRLELLELLADRRPPREDLVRGSAVLAEEPLEYHQTRLEVVQTARLGLEVAQTLRELAAELLEPRPQLLELAERPRRERLPAGDRGQCLFGRRDPLARRSFVLEQARLGAAERGDDRLAMADAVAFLAELHLLARGQARLVDLPGVEAEQIDPLRAQPLVPGQALEPVGDAPPSVVGGAGRRHETLRLGAPRAVEPLPLQLGVEQAELVALAVDAQQLGRDLLQQAQRRRLVVQEDAVAPLAADLPPDDELVSLGFEAGVDQARAQSLRQVEDPGDRERVGALAHQLGGRPLPGEEPQRVHHQRLAGAGFSGQHVEAAAELDLAAGEHREVPDVEAAQQVGFSAPERFTRG